MSKHPLTDEILGRQFDGIETSSFHQTPPASIHDYLTVEQSQWLFDEQDMRAAADWQLEQVLEWLDEYGQDYFDHYSLGRPSVPNALQLLLGDLLTAMRPTQEDNQ